MAAKRGMDCKLYYDTTPLAGIPSTGNWTEAANIRNVNTNLETGEADATTRANGGWRQTVPTLKDGTIEFEMLQVPDDAAFDAFETAWKAGAEIAVAAMSGAVATSGSKGLAGNFMVTNFSRSEALEDVVVYNVTLKPSSYNTWYTAS
jgi:TP901-1 family phage major tail protein